MTKQSKTFNKAVTLIANRSSKDFITMKGGK